MDIATLLHSLTVAGLTLRRGSGDSLEVLGDVTKVTPTQREALSRHKAMLLVMLTPPPTCNIPTRSEPELVTDSAFAEELAEHFAAEWVEATGTQRQVSQALADAMELFTRAVYGRKPPPEDTQPIPPLPLRFFDELKAAHNARGFDLLRLEPGPQQSPCRRCGSRQSFLAIIHWGDSLRRDCASCGRFRHFAVGKEKSKAEHILANPAEQARYNTKAGCSSATNTQATLTTSPY
jgi:hypothetical protein